MQSLNQPPILQVITHMLSRKVAQAADRCVMFKVYRTLAHMDCRHAIIGLDRPRQRLHLALTGQALLSHNVEAKPLGAIIQGLGCKDNKHGRSFRVIMRRCMGCYPIQKDRHRYTLAPLVQLVILFTFPCKESPLGQHTILYTLFNRQPSIVIQRR